MKSDVFNKNLAVLEQYMPDIFHVFKDYQPENTFLISDENKNLNLIKNEKKIYPENPEKITLKQVELFKKNPLRLAYRPAIDQKNYLKDSDFLHNHHLSRIESLQKEDPDFLPAGKEFPYTVPYLLMVGIGLGYHLQALVKGHDIRHILVFEPEPDVFHAFLHVIDLEPIIRKCTEGFRSLSFKIGDTATGFVNHVANFLRREGHFNACRLYLYRHYSSQEVDTACERLHNLLHRTLHGWGFYEDELIGVAHTLINLKAQPLWIKRPDQADHFACTRPTRPAFIIANGPSLDQSIEVIKQHQNHAVLFSTGSTLKALYESGITPDFHVEIERTRNVDDWLTDINDPDYLKKITLITLNTVHPDVITRFGKTMIALKPKDTGSWLVRNSMGDDLVYLALHSGPTAVNGNVSFALSLGFKTLYLFGVDLGVIDPEYHHSKQSAYFKSEDARFHIKSMDCTVPVKGNFRGQVLTNSELDVSQFEIERALNFYRDAKCFNCSDGIKISGTKPMPPDEINLATECLDKKNEINRLLENRTLTKLDDFYNQTTNLFFRHYNFIQELCTNLIKVIEISPQSLGEMLDQFTLQKKILLSFEEKSPVSFSMIAGTLTYFQCVIATFAFDYQDEVSAMQFVKKAFKVFKNHLNIAPILIQEHYKDAHESYFPGRYL